MIDYRYWKLDTPHAASAKDLVSVLEKARDEYLNTNTPAVRGVNNLWTVDEPLRDAIVKQMTAGIRSAVIAAEAMGAGAFVRASMSGHVVVGADSGIDERMTMYVDKVAAPRATAIEPTIAPRISLTAQEKSA